MMLFIRLFYLTAQLSCKYVYGRIANIYLEANKEARN